MSSEASTVQATTPYTSSNPAERVTLSQIDTSLKGPAILFMVSGVLWLLAGTVLGMIASIKLNDPTFLGDFASMTFGRVRAAHLNAMAYGWATNAAFIVNLWMMARLCRVPSKYSWLITVSGCVWNIAITIGIIGILAGHMTSVEWLEMPTYITPVIAVAYAFIGVWGVIFFSQRRTEHVYVSQWYILGAIFWFPWLYTVAQIMILFEPAQGVIQALANWWFAHNVLGLWLTPTGLAAAYYFIPKVLGRPIHSYHLSIIGFWTLALFYNWAGVHHLIGGPIPAWVVTAGVVGSVMMVIPVVVTAINHHMTVVGRFKDVWESPTLRFIVFGAVNYTLVSLFGSTMALPSVNETTHFSHFTVGHAHHGVYAFFTMIMFGAIYFMMPRILHREWPSASLIRGHFWCSALGITLMVVALQVGGWIQGMEMNNPDIAFLDIVKNTQPYLVARSLSGLLITIGHMLFAVNIYFMIFGTPRMFGGPTLLRPKAA